jgi:hypothetical protein
VNRFRVWVTSALVILTTVIVVPVVERRARPAGSRVASPRSGPAAIRERLFGELEPVALANCTMRRAGDPHDGGYLVCENLLTAAQAVYSYGISGYDQWGCELSRRLRVPVHRYDCFDTRDPPCPGGDPIFHAECVGPAPSTLDGRRFDTMASQIAKNGDLGRRLVVKMDVEGAEWESLLATPDAVLDGIDQLVVEFHRAEDPMFVVAVQKLKERFLVVNLHFNNHGCEAGLEPFPSWAFEVLFVSKGLGIVDPAARAPVPHPLDAPNDPTRPDCQAAVRR